MSMQSIYNIFLKSEINKNNKLKKNNFNDEWINNIKKDIFVVLYTHCIVLYYCIIIILYIYVVCIRRQMAKAGLSAIVKYFLFTPI